MSLQVFPLLCAWRTLAAGVLGLLLAVAAAAQAPATEPRLALLIGNAGYARSPLVNPINDVRLMEASLKEVGFQVIKAENANRRDMQRVIREFGDRLKQSGGIGLFYFAGHGVQVRGNNYLIPVDADIRAEDEVAFDSIDAQSVLEKMETAKNRVNLLILDACRDNPFARTRSMSAGLATMSAPTGSLVAYSTAPGAVASDGSGRNSLYTEHLARVLRSPGLPVEEVFKQVRTAVRRDSKGQQTPWENTALEGQFFFKAADAFAAPADANQGDLALWGRVKASSTPADLRGYLERYPAGVFADLALARLSSLESMAVERARPTAIATIPPGSASAAARPPTLPNSSYGTLVIKDRFSPQERRVEVTQRTAADGATLWSTGDEVAADGQVRAVRISEWVAKVRQGALWKLPLVAGTSGSAEFESEEPKAIGSIRWKVSSSADGLATVEAAVVYDRLSDVGAAGNYAMRGEWSGQYRPGFQVPLRTKVELRGNSAGRMDIGSAEVVGYAPIPPAPAGLLVVRDRLTGRESQIAVEPTRLADGGVRWTSGDHVGPDAQVRAVRLGSNVAVLESGALWQFPLRAGTSGSAAVRVDGQHPGTLTWKVIRDGSEDVVDGRIDYDMGTGNTMSNLRRGTWRAKYREPLQIPASFVMDMRGHLQGFDLSSGELRETAAR